MMNFFTNLINYIELIDNKFEGKIIDFLNYYNLPEFDAPFFTTYLKLFIKITIYTMVLIIPVTITKIIYNSKKIVLVIFLGVLITLALSLIGTFLGFFQLVFI